jgi:hypothetical protein
MTEMKSAITIKKTQDRDNEYGSGACWELSNGDWIECVLHGERTTLAGEHHTYRVDGYELDGESFDVPMFFSVKEYGTARRAFEAAKRYSIEGTKS